MCPSSDGAKSYSRLSDLSLALLYLLPPYHSLSTPRFSNPFSPLSPFPPPCYKLSLHLSNFIHLLSFFFCPTFSLSFFFPRSLAKIVWRLEEHLAKDTANSIPSGAIQKEDVCAIVTFRVEEPNFPSFCCSFSPDQV